MNPIIIYVSHNREDLLNEIVDKNFFMIETYQKKNLESFLSNYGSVLSHAKYFVLDLKTLTDSNDDLVRNLNKVNRIYSDTKIVILADDEKIHTYNTDLLRRMVDRNIYNIVTDLDELEHAILVGKTKDEALEFTIEKPELSTKEDRQERENRLEEFEEQERIQEKNNERQALEDRIQKREIIKANADFKKYKPYISIAVGGAEEHIGSTHLALQVVSFLNSIGFRSCYLESTKEHKIHTLKSVYPKETNVNERRNLLQWKGLDIYSDFSMSKVMAQKYDFYILDYGELTEENSGSYLTKDIKMLVGGTKAWEIYKLRDKLSLIGTKNHVYYFLNFLIPEEESQIFSIMGELSKFTFFSSYEPSPTLYKGNIRAFKEIFEEFIIQDEEIIIEPKKKKRFFGMFS